MTLVQRQKWVELLEMEIPLNGCSVHQGQLQRKVRSYRQGFKIIMRDFCV